MNRKTNILLIHSDQHRYDCLSCHGHPQVKTPNLDRLAAEGTDFSLAFTPSPICSPARASLLTGRWPVNHGCLSIPGTEQYRPADSRYPTFSMELKKAGYNLAYIGKYHGETQQPPEEIGFDEFIPENEYFTWRREQGIPERELKNGWFGETDHFAKPSQTRLSWGCDLLQDRLKDYSSQESPFFLRWDPSEPHLPNVVPEPYASLYPPESIAPWGSFNDPLEGKPVIQKQQKQTWEIDSWTWHDWAPIVSRYLGEITLLDECIGRILNRLDELGLSEDTMVIYTTDHGDMCGAHGQIDKHFVMYDDVVRVPLIIRYPGRFPAGKVSDSFVSHEIDVARTIIEAAGLSVPSSFEGESLFSVALGNSRRQEILSMYHGSQFSSFTQRMIRTKRWKYIWNACAEDELYDLETDPHEINNRTDDDKCSTVLAHMRKRLVNQMENIEDIMLNQWTRKQLEKGYSL